MSLADRCEGTLCATCVCIVCTFCLHSMRLHALSRASGLLLLPTHGLPLVMLHRGLEISAIFRTLPTKKEMPEYYAVITDPVDTDAIRK